MRKMFSTSFRMKGIFFHYKVYYAITKSYSNSFIKPKNYNAEVSDGFQTNKINAQDILNKIFLNKC